MTKDAPADQALIEAIAKLLNEQNLAEIEIEREDLRVRVTRSYASSGVQQVMAGVNTSRHDAYRCMLGRGYRTVVQGVAMQQHNALGHNRADCFVIDDWR